jgi:hypothetical protein
MTSKGKKDRLPDALPDMGRLVRAEYCPPSADVVFRFARSVGAGLGGEFAEPLVVQGLADFMTVVAQILAHDLNRKAQAGLDNHVE